MIFGLLVARSTFHSISIKFLLKMDDFGAPPEDTVECLALAKTTKPQPQPQPQGVGGVRLRTLKGYDKLLNSTRTYFRHMCGSRAQGSRN